MGLLDRITEARRSRAFALGPAVVERADRSWGHDDLTYSPPEYGDYLVISNAVYSCARLRADLIAGLPLQLWAGEGRARREVTQGRLRDLLKRVNPFWTKGRLFYMTELSLQLWGEAFWVLDGGRPPSEIWWARPDRMRVVPHPRDYIAGYLYEPTNASEKIAFRADEVVWFRYPNPLDEYSSLSPIAAARLAADLESASAKSNRNLFSQGIQMGGLLAPKEGKTFSTEQAVELEEALERRFKGVDKAHRWGVLRFEAQATSLGMSPKDAEFLGTLDWSLTAVCRAMGVPVELLSGGKRTYENLPAALRALWELSLAPEARFLAEELEEQLLRPHFAREADSVEFDLKPARALRDEENRLWERAVSAWRNGAIGERMLHELLGLDFDPEDRRLLSGTDVLVTLDGTPPPAAQAAPAQVETASVVGNGHLRP